jgi:hypothetical protein
MFVLISSGAGSTPLARNLKRVRFEILSSDANSSAVITSPSSDPISISRLLGIYPPLLDPISAIPSFPADLSHRGPCGLEILLSPEVVTARVLPRWGDLAMAEQADQS